LPIERFARCDPMRAVSPKTTAYEPPSGEQWLHELGHDGYRLIAWKNAGKITLYGRERNDLTERFPLVVEALVNLRQRVSSSL
jgi:bifunctional non-homologous end joining protein LigD